MPNTLDTLRRLGYDVGVAFGDVQHELDALEAAKADFDPATVAEQAASITQATIADLNAVGQLPLTPQERQELAAKIAESALQILGERANGKVAFHERAVEIARGMPTVYTINGEGFSGIRVAINDATGDAVPESAEIVASLVNEDARAERRWQYRLRNHLKAAEIFEAVRTLRAKGYTVKPEAQEDGTGLQVTITGGPSPVIADTLTKLKTAARDLPPL